MRWRILLPCGGILLGAVTGWVFSREAQAAGGHGKHRIAEVLPASTSATPAPPAAIPGRPTLEEIQSSWGEEGATGIYAALEGIPAATLAAWLEEFRPPENYRRTLERERREGMQQALVERLTELDPMALAKWISRLPPGYINSAWLSGVTEGLTNEGSPEALAMTARLKNMLFWPWGGGLDLSPLAKQDPEAALAQVIANPGAWMPKEVVALLAADPGRAVAFVNAHPERSAQILAAMARRGGAELDKFVAQLSPASQGEVDRVKLSVRAWEGDAAGFTEIFVRASATNYDPNGQAAIQALARHHPEAAAEVIRGLGEKPELRSMLLENLAEAHPEQAAFVLLELHASGADPAAYEQNVMRALARSWAVDDPAAAREWLRALPGDLRAELLPHSRDLAEKATDADWLAMTRGLPLKERNVYVLASQAARRNLDPQVLADWSASFPEEARPALVKSLVSLMKDEATRKDLQQRVDQALNPTAP